MEIVKKKKKKKAWRPPAGILHIHTFFRNLDCHLRLSVMEGIFISNDIVASEEATRSFTHQYVSKQNLKE
jgi:hypothetical protein